MNASTIKQLEKSALLVWLVISLLVPDMSPPLSLLPDLDGVKDRIVITTYDSGNRPVKREIGPGAAGFVFSSRLPRHVVGAILVSEDAHFYKHHGVDWGQMRNAFVRNLKTGRYAIGASTITQQVVKNAFLTREKTLSRKAVEIFTALRLEHTLTKQEILDYYINLVQLGPGVYGIREGARFYFNTEPKNLTPGQAALLAFFIPSPSKRGRAYASGKPGEYRNRRVRIILQRMVNERYADAGAIAQGQ